MIPEIEIVYSDIYDAFVQVLQKKGYTNWKARGNAGKRFAKRLSNKTKTILPKALKFYEQVSGLKWNEKKVEVFVINSPIWDFSWPVTIKIRSNMWDATETLLHEFSHQIVRQSWKKVKANNKIYRKYKNEHFVVTQHILPHAILWKAYEKLFGPRKLKNIIKGYTRWKWHYRAWQIVKEEGADNIIKAYVK